MDSYGSHETSGMFPRRAEPRFGMLGLSIRGESTSSTGYGASHPPRSQASLTFDLHPIFAVKALAVRTTTSVLVAYAFRPCVRKHDTPAWRKPGADTTHLWWRCPQGGPPWSGPIDSNDLAANRDGLVPGDPASG